jgi:hypothetical protein
MRSSGVRVVGDEDIDGVAASLSRVLQSRQFKTITLASTTQGLGGGRWALEDDAITAAALRNAMPAPLAERVKLVPGYLSPQEYAALAARHSAVVSMRMHGALLASNVGTPALLANGSDKARGLPAGFPVVQELGRLDEHLDELQQNRTDWAAGQAEAVATMRRHPLQNARRVAALLKS